MSKKFIPVILVLTGASFFIAFKSQGKTENDDNPKLRYTKVLRNVGLLLEEGHYSPKKIDDDFSKAVFKEFISDLDGDKKVFLQGDIDSLKKYETNIDDEIHGSPFESFYAINDLYQRRQSQTALLYKDILSKPFDFTLDEDLVLDPEKTTFAKTEAEQKDVWRKYLKYLVLDKFVAAQNDRDKNKDKPNFKVKADSTLEREARMQVSKQMERSFTTIKSRETSDYNFSTFVNAITGTMDPHTNYFPPVDLRSFNESMKGSFFGIGAVIKEEDGKIKIGALQTGMPAWKSGEIKENDELLKVGQGDTEPVDVTGYAVQDAVKLIRGSDLGSVVKLTIRKVDGSTRIVALKRDKIDVDDTFAKSVIIKGEHKIGYIYLPEFYANFDDPKGSRCAIDVANELDKLKAEKVDGIVLDLRGNGGGSLYDVVQMAGLFIEDGPICQVKGRDDKPQVLRDRDKSVKYDGPFAVMVDETSASASEIFAAAIQDYKRGVIIGSTSTYGKGTVQRNVPLNPASNGNTTILSKDDEDLGTVKLTLQKFYRINGDATQMKGVVPDIVLPDRLEFLKIREKDNPNALKYDEIAKADYKTWTSTYSDDAIIKSANADAMNATFGKIKTNAEWLEKNADKEYSLNIVKYKDEQKQFKDIYKQSEDLYKLPKPLMVTNLSSDTVGINKTKEKIERNKDFVKRVGNDIYIDETVKVINKMIIQSNLAKTN